MPVDTKERAILKNEDEILYGCIVSGMPISETTHKQITKHFEEMLGKQVKLSCHLDREQIMGVRVELNGYSYDGTLRGQLDDLRKLLTHPKEERSH